MRIRTIVPDDRRAILFTGLSIFMLAAPGLAKPHSDNGVLIEQVDTSSPDRPSGMTLSLSAAPAFDTTYYGGTIWAPDSARWEALRDSVWTFDTGFGSSINNGGNPGKPIGYHQTMEGWTGLDFTADLGSSQFRRSSTCAISGSFSLWAGLTTPEADALCWVSGQGYGNGWRLLQEKKFMYPGTGNVTLSYDYSVECEALFDYAYALVDTIGNGTCEVEIAVYTGTVSGTENLTLIPGISMRSTPGPMQILFLAASDGSYSDQDGLNPTTCGHSSFDNVTLGGAVVDFSDFETGDDGWTLRRVADNVGDFSNLVHLNDLPATATFCPCDVQDSVLVFYDDVLQHPRCQQNVVYSPWIDLKAGGDVGRPGRLMAYDIYAELPIANYIFVIIRARWYPSVCPSTGKLFTTPFRDQNIAFYYGEAPFCSGGADVRRDYSNVIEAGAEQVQVAWGAVEAQCNAIIFGYNGNSGWTSGNTTPWIDNIRFGVYGSAGAPIVSMTTPDRLQDSFATDGSLDPGSTARLDPGRILGGLPNPGTRAGDTLVARGNGGNTEVRLVFQVRPGPFTNTTALAARAARWTPEPGPSAAPGAFGGTWYSARLDTAQNGTMPAAGIWMGTFHETDPGFVGTDTTPDPMNPNQLENEILPDHILTAGSRVDYFIASRYMPPDPRNPGDAWYVSPDTTGGAGYYEAEVLPTSVSIDTTWNCTLYVDHHDDRDEFEQSLEEAGLSAALGGGSGNPEGTPFDRWDVVAPSSNQTSLGRPPGANYGATLAQLFAYRNVVWHSGDLSSNQLTDADADVLAPWLRFGSTGNRFWGSGDNLVNSIQSAGGAPALDFMNNVLGVTLACNTIRDAACPTGTLLDSTYCLPLAAAGAPAFITTLPANIRDNGCPRLRSLDLLDLSGTAPGAAGQLAYTKNSVATDFASVTNENASGSPYRTVIDGFAVGSLRTNPGDPHVASLCNNTASALSRTLDVLSWFGSPLLCNTIDLTAVPEPGPVPPTLRHALGRAVPNPMTSGSRIEFVNATDDERVSVQIFDVAGRLVVTLVNDRLPAGPHSVAWNGAAEDGQAAPAGLYFYRMTAGDYSASGKVIVHR